MRCGNAFPTPNMKEDRFAYKNFHTGSSCFTSVLWSYPRDNLSFILLQALLVEDEMKNLNLQVTLLVQKGVGTSFPPHYTPDSMQYDILPMNHHFVAKTNTITCTSEVFVVAETFKHLLKLPKNKKEILGHKESHMVNKKQGGNSGFFSMCWLNAFLHGGNSDVISLHQLETKRKIFILLKVNSKIPNFRIQGCEPLPELWLYCLCPQGIRCFTRTATFPLIGIGQGRAILFSLRAEISSMTRFFCALTKI